MNIAIIGAGVVGCAIAQKLSVNGHAVYILEKEARIGEGATSRNSGVIHAGLYYPAPSLKAKYCIRGNILLYEWCRKYGVAHKKTGKFVVAHQSEFEAEFEELNSILQNAKACGATGVRMAQMSEIPQTINCDLALYSSNTGIVDPFELTRSLLASAESNGAILITSCELLSTVKRGSWLIKTSRGDIECDYIINSAGLNSDEIAAKVSGLKHQLYPWRGDYFKSRKKLSIHNLIYPVKNKNAPGLGIHLTLDLDGKIKFGPDAYITNSKNDFSEPVDLAEKRLKFHQAISSYIPDISVDDLEYDGCGIRSKLRSPDDISDPDFLIVKGCEQSLHLIGIESPGLTAALAIAESIKL